jgi:hypothetical protein
MSPPLAFRPTSVEGRGFDATVVLVRGDVEVASWPLRGRQGPGLAVADELARLQLTARRMGCSIHLRRPSADLLALLDLVGLSEVVTQMPLRVEVLGEAEGREQAGIDEVVVPDDPIT